MFNCIFSLSLAALAIANPGAAFTGAAIWYLGKNKPMSKPRREERKDREEDEESWWF